MAVAHQDSGETHGIDYICYCLEPSPESLWMSITFATEAPPLYNCVKLCPLNAIATRTQIIKQT